VVEPKLLLELLVCLFADLSVIKTIGTVEGVV
jgi:hypothetical protein